MSDDSKSGDPAANLGGPSTLSSGFNADVELGAQIAALSPEAKMKVEVFQKTSEQRQADERKQQQRNRPYRVLKQKVELYENYIRDQGNRPAEIRADPTPDLKIMADRAEEIVRANEEYFLKRIEREAAANIRQVIANERKGQGHSAPDREPDLEP